jgi:ATP-dependent RNA helicase RhlE
VDAYTHRIGRTGRAEQEGDAFTFVSPEDEPMVRDIERVLGMALERRYLENFNYGAPIPAGSEDRRPPRPGRGQPSRRPAQSSNAPRKSSAAKPAPAHNGSKQAETSNAAVSDSSTDDKVRRRRFRRRNPRSQA